MPKDQYDTDLYMASDDDTIEGAYIVGTGENEGEFLFQYHPKEGEPSTISVIIVDLPNYPSRHEVFIFGCGDDAASLGEKLSDLPSLAGTPIKQIMVRVVQHLRNKETDGSKKRPFVVNDDDVGFGHASQSSQARHARKTGRLSHDDDDDNGDDLYTTGPTLDKGKKVASGSPPVITPTSPSQRIITDLRAAKDAGFKLGYHGSLKGTGVCYVVISCRLSRLGISDNALDAWHVETKRYLSLIIEYPAGYANLDDLCDELKRSRSDRAKANIRMRIRQNDQYKPTKAQCQAAFKRADPNIPYILQTLELFLNERMITLLKKRLELGFTWFGAEEYYFLDKKKAASSVEAMEAKYWHDDTPINGFSRLVTSDHFMAATGIEKRSFPLIAMQLFLRHFARYTDFCLVCHRTVDTDVEALEPYVCSTPACLAKYLSSDFGPGIEKDIVEQPYVVDLLVSFCYAAAKHQKLKDFPDALNLKVPFPPGSGGYTGTFDRANKDLTLRINATTPISHPVQVGTWMAITGAGAAGETLCCRATDMSQFPTIKVSDPISTTAQASALKIGAAYTGGSAATAGSHQVAVYVYNQDFAGLTPQQKQDVICLLLDTLPSVREMKDRLRQGHLASWGDRISPAALGVLRWIIASNRACIVQVDGLETGSNGVFPATQTEDRVYGMGNWMQFRFAMGAPDKEQKFQTASSNTTRRLRLRYPTMFAWHGSPLINWHSIIREGLNFNQTLNGRAYGNGCYHSLDFRTSLGYTHNRYASAAGSDQWSKSVLKVSGAVALNEIVNAPGEFVSKSPHLVVAQLDWICTRYLFVQCAFSSQGVASSKTPSQVKPQDPSMTPNGEQGKIVIPQPKAARARKDDLLDENKKGKKKSEPAYTLVTIDGIEERIPVAEDPASDATDGSDLDIFVEEHLPTPATVSATTSDSLNISDLDVAIALSMETARNGSSSSSSSSMPPLSDQNRRRTSFFSGFANKGRASNENRPSIAGNSSISTFPGSGSSSVAQPPSYDDIPITATPPNYTPVADTNGTGFFTNPFAATSSNNANGSAEPPRYALRSTVSNVPAASSSAANNSGSISRGKGLSGGFFGGFKRGLSFGAPANNDSWDSYPPAVPGSDSVNQVGGPKGKGKSIDSGTAPVISAPFAVTSSNPLINGGYAQPNGSASLIKQSTVDAIKATNVPAASTSTAPIPIPVNPTAAGTSNTQAVTAPAVVVPVVAPPVVAAPKAPEPPKTDFVAGQLDYNSLPLIAQPTFATHQATKRLQREYKNLLKIQDSTPLHELGWYTNPDHFENVYQWIVELHTFDAELPLAKDMKSQGVKSVVLELRFGASFPNTPPFVRVIKPRFLPFMNGGGGHVTIGGAVCLEMLTGTGWDSKTTIESILMNVRLAMMSTDPKPAKLESGGGGKSYGVAEAVSAYLRACRTHGWTVPKGFEEMAKSTS
ncbi:hypothetical protein TWF106_010376 [Orbilia oligospora]|uniref:UBC core domain-containing protein n=1 Tax=Orbilia oligospora TaxID=2813651 RepID=A0A7C8UD56_ORBOL|nr:hypothetical protein TWF679_009936 [Orbilia oligospora]KAF3210982.1 hypothetical protein TWF106_010376 [Orbilia oligospora]